MLTPVQEIINIQYSYHSAKAALQRVNKLFALSKEPSYPHQFLLLTQRQKVNSIPENEFLKNKTTIIIVHRLSAVKQADRVFVFDEGRIIEEGHHDSLIRENGLYMKLYGRQGH